MSAFYQIEFLLYRNGKSLKLRNRLYCFVETIQYLSVTYVCISWGSTKFKLGLTYKYLYSSRRKTKHIFP